MRLGLLLFGIIVVGLLALETCTGHKVRLDPTDGTFAVVLDNDTQATVVVEHCDVKCNVVHSVYTLVPHQSARVNTSDSSVPNWYMVTDGAGVIAGCVNLLFDHMEPDAIVSLSRLLACP